MSINRKAFAPGFLKVAEAVFPRAKTVVIVDTIAVTLLDCLIESQSTSTFS
jgi:hypothetical protein